MIIHKIVSAIKTSTTKDGTYFAIAFHNHDALLDIEINYGGKRVYIQESVNIDEKKLCNRIDEGIDLLYKKYLTTNLKAV